MSNQTRVKQLEKIARPAPVTWLDFITGKWEPSPKAWHAFLNRDKPKTEPKGDNENEYSGTTK